MEGFELIHQRDKLIYPDVIFNRPISGLARLQVPLFGGKKGSLSTLSQLYGAVSAMGLSPTCVTEEKAAPLAMLPVGSMHLHVDKNSNQIVETADVLSFVGRSNVAILAPDIDLGSSIQILFEKVFTQTQTPLIITDEAVKLYSLLPQATRKRSDVLFFVSNQGLIGLVNALRLAVDIRPGRGVYNTLAIADTIHAATRAHVVVYGDEELVVRAAGSTTERGIIHLRSGTAYGDRGLLLGILVGLLADHSQSFTQVMEKTLTAGYLFNAITLASKELRDPILADRLIKETLQRELQ